jgi:radical SAM protein with 4Fe4S-binding SPASM domain
MNKLDVNVTSISQTIEVPCKNPDLELAQKSLISTPRDNFFVRVDPVWSFYYPKNPTRPAFQDCYFEKNDGYDWVFITEAPLKIFFEITRTCNLKCKWCYIPDMMWDNMDMEKIRSIIDDAKDSWVISIQLLWWEPTLHPNFLEICKYIKSKWISVEAVSNWVKITKDYANQLRWNMDYLAISIDWSKETHNEFRWSPKSYQKAMSAFHNLKEAWVNTEVLMTVNKTNIWDIETVLKEIWGNPLDLYLKIMHLADKMPDNLKEICLNRKEVVDLKQKALDLWLWIQAPVADFKLPGNSSFFWCPWWIITWIVDTSWNVHKCLYIRDEKEVLWNVFEKSFREIWNDTKTRIEQSMWTKCQNCALKSSCWWLCTLCKTENRYF